MSKGRIQSTNSTLDPFSFERSVAQQTSPLKQDTPAYQQTTQDIETLTPFKVDEGQSFLGNSQYQQQAHANQLAEDESAWSLIGKGIKNLAGTVITEVGKLPGYVGGAAMAIGNEAFGDGKNSMKLMVDNAWVNQFEKMDQSIQDWMPVHIKQDVANGDLSDKMGSGAWWATSGASGVGFLLSMYGPGVLLKAGKIGEATLGGLSKLAETSQGAAELLGLGSDFIKPFKVSLNTARQIDGYAAAFTNASVEAASEAANTFDNVHSKNKQKYIDQGLSETEADQRSNQEAGEAAAAVFKTNMIILPLSNMLEEKWLWKSIGLKNGTSEAADGLISKFTKDGILDIEGLKNASKRTFKQMAGDILKEAPLNVIKEGFIEEGLQTRLQQRVESGHHEDNALLQLKDTIAHYADDFQNNKELHESIFLGGLLGGLGGTFGAIKQARDVHTAIYGNQGQTPSRISSFLNKVGLRQTQKDQRGLSNLLSENWIQNFRSYKDLLGEDGKLDDTKLAALPEDQRMIANLHFLYDAAVQLDDKHTQNVVGQFLATNYVKPFLGQDGGKEVFQQHVENQVVPQWKARFEEVTKRSATDQEIEDYKSRFLASANKVFDIYHQVEDTHYPEKYFVDKENPSKYNEFKSHYFNQKFQALTNINETEKLIQESESNLSQAGIFEGATLNGKQKTIKKLEEGKLEGYNKHLKESADYYESLFTKKGVKDLYDIFSKQKDVLPQEVAKLQEDTSKEIKVGEQKVQDIQQAENKLEEDLANNNFDKLTIESLVKKIKSGTNEYTKAEEQFYELNSDDIEKTLKESLDPVTEQSILNEHNNKLYRGINDIEEQSNNLRHSDQYQRSYELDSAGLPKEYLKNKNGQIAETYINNEDERVIIDPISKEEIPLDGEKIINEDWQVIPDSEVSRELSKLDTPLTTPEIINEVNELPIDEKLHEALLQNDLGTGLYPSTGLHVSYILDSNKRVYDELTPEGLPKLNESKHQKNWFQTISEIKDLSEHSVKVVNKLNADPDQLKVILENAGDQLKDTDLFIFLHKNDKPVIKDNDPVFTSLWRPESLYKTNATQEQLAPRIAPSTIFNSFLNSIGIASPDYINEDLSNFSDHELILLEAKIGKENMSESGLWNNAVRYAKDDYTKWYNSLQQDNTFLQPIGITNGKRLIRRDQNRKVIWNKVEGNIPDFKIKNGKLVGGELVQQYTTQGIEVGDKYYNVGIGDTAIVANNQLYRLKQQTLNNDEVKSVLYLLSLKQNAPQESVTLPVKTTILAKNNTGGFAVKNFNETPVFGSNVDYGIIKSLINFGYGNRNGNIYLNGMDVVFIDFTGQQYSVPISDIQEAFKTNDFSKIKDLSNFLAQKKFNINENLLRANSNFQLPVLKRSTSGEYQIEFEDKGKYQTYLLQEGRLLTDSVIAEGYPKRLSQNLQFAQKPTIKVSEKVVTQEEQSIPEDIKKAELKAKLANRTKTQLPNLNADKIFSPEDLLKQKLQSGEITKYCI